jgi:hypothetical protein
MHSDPKLLAMYKVADGTELNCIPELPISSGFKCAHCTLSNPDLDSMKFHSTSFHPECDADTSVQPCLIQNPWNVWVRVKSKEASVYDHNSFKSGGRVGNRRTNSFKESLEIDKVFDDVLAEKLTTEQLETLRSLNAVAIDRIGSFICTLCSAIIVILGLYQARPSIIVKHKCISIAEADGPQGFRF